MPIYDFIDTNTGEQFTKMLKLAERETYLAENPHIQTQILSAPRMVRGTSTQGIKNDDGWNENLARIAEAHPTSALANKVRGRSAKEVKTQEALKKHNVESKANYKMEELNYK